jgi:ABC-type phosphate transport system substrate-binding protein
MLTNGHPRPGGQVHRLVTLHLTRNGQAIVKGKGYIPVADD